MIQFNLLPDVKINYLKARAFKRRILSVSLIVMGASIGLVLFVLSVQLGQKKHIKDLTSDISTEVKAVKNNPDVSKVLTIQNQLSTLPNLHGEKPVTSRFFEFIGKLTPTDVGLSQLRLSTTDSTVVISGSAPSAEAVNRYADTIKFATYKTASGQEGKPFSSVSTSVNRSSEGASFEITVVYDPIILNSKEGVSLVVPTQTTTRSETEKPSQLFQGSEEGTE